MPNFSPEHILILVAAFIAAFIFGHFYRLILKKFRTKSIQKRAVNNIGKTDRIVRIALGIFLLYSGLQTWSPITLFLSGFCFYEAFATWCGFYAVFGANTCKLN